MAAILVEQWLGVRAHPHWTKHQFACKRRAGQPADHARVSDQMCWPGSRYHLQHLVEGCPSGYDDRFHSRGRRHVEQRGAGVRRCPGFEHGEAGRCLWRPVLFFARLHAPRQACGRHIELPIPHIDAAHAARAAGAEHHLIFRRIRKPLLLSESPLGTISGEVPGGDDRVPFGLSVLLGHDRERRQVGDSRRVRVESLQTPRMKR
jgi:hypothetical protein